jgi:hypothetical protein
MVAQPKLSNASKMPCKSWSLPAVVSCPGSRNADGTLVPACSGCYATRGRYKFGAVKALRIHNLDDWKHIGWIPAMVKAIGKAKYFRWFDSGDIPEADLATKIYEVIKQTPNCEHWLPTRSYKIPLIRYWLNLVACLPNVTVRLSSDSVTGERIPGKYTSTIIQREKDFIPSKGYALCRAFERKGKCGSCRACWSKDIHTIAYIAH